MEKWLGMTLWHSRDSGQAQREVVPPEAPRRRAAGVFGGSAPDQTGSGKAEVRWKSWCFFRWSVSSSCFGLELCFSNGQTAIRRRLVSDACTLTYFEALKRNQRAQNDSSEIWPQGRRRGRAVPKHSDHEVSFEGWFVSWFRSWLVQVRPSERRTSPTSSAGMRPVAIRHSATANGRASAVLSEVEGWLSCARRRKSSPRRGPARLASAACLDPSVGRSPTRQASWIISRRSRGRPCLVMAPKGRLSPLLRSLGHRPK